MLPWPRGRFPLGAKIASIQQPSSRTLGNTEIRIRTAERWWLEFDIQIEFRMRLLTHEPIVALVHLLQNIRIVGFQPDGDIANGDHYAEAFDLCGYPWHGSLDSL